MDTVSDTLTPSVEHASTATVVNRFATCCRSLGLSVNDRQRPADLAAARSGFTEGGPESPANSATPGSGWPPPERARTPSVSSPPSGAPSAPSARSPAKSSWAQRISGSPTTPACTCSSGRPTGTTSRWRTPPPRRGRRVRRGRSACRGTDLTSSRLAASALGPGRPLPPQPALVRTSVRAADPGGQRRQARRPLRPRLPG